MRFSVLTILMCRISWILDKFANILFFTAALKREAKDVQTASMEDFANRMRVGKYSYNLNLNFLYLLVTDPLNTDADASVTNYILFYNPEENARSKYDETFGKFREVVFIFLSVLLLFRLLMSGCLFFNSGFTHRWMFTSTSCLLFCILFLYMHILT